MSRKGNPPVAPLLFTKRLYNMSKTLLVMRSLPLGFVTDEKLEHACKSLLIFRKNLESDTVLLNATRKLKISEHYDPNPRLATRASRSSDDSSFQLWHI